MRPRPPRLLLWLALVLAALVFEVSLSAAVVLRDARVDARREVPWVNFGVSAGRYFLIIPHDAAGRNPHIQPGSRTSLLGFDLWIASSGMSRDYMRVTMITVPCWFVALLAGLTTWWTARRLGLRLIRRQPPRGFEVIEQP